MMKIFLYSPKYIENVAAMGRTMEVLGYSEIFVYDNFGIFTGAPMGKSNKRKLTKISSGAFQYLTFTPIEDPIEFIKNYPGRTVATVLHHESESLYRFKFGTDDLLMMGNETHGLPDEIIELAHSKIKIDQSGKTESLNLGIALGILLFEERRQQFDKSNNILKDLNRD